MLSTVPMGACRPCPSSRKERSWRACQHQPGRSPLGLTPTWRSMWPRSSTRPGDCSAPRPLRPRLVAMSPWSPGPSASERWHASGSKAPAPTGRAGPLRPCLRPPGSGGRPPRPQHTATTGQVGSDRRPGRRPVDPGRGGRHDPQDPRRPGGDDPGAAGRPPRRPQGPSRGRASNSTACSTAPPRNCANRCLASRPRRWSGFVRPCGPGH